MANSFSRTAFPTALNEPQALTKREYFAVMSLQGLIANQPFNNFKSDLVKDAVEYADALIKELNK